MMMMMSRNKATADRRYASFTIHIRTKVSEYISGKKKKNETERERGRENSKLPKCNQSTLELSLQSLVNSFFFISSYTYMYMPSLVVSFVSCILIRFVTSNAVIFFVGPQPKQSD